MRYIHLYKYSPNINYISQARTSTLGIFNLKIITKYYTTIEDRKNNKLKIRTQSIIQFKYQFFSIFSPVIYFKLVLFKIFYGFFFSSPSSYLLT